MPQRIDGLQRAPLVGALDEGVREPLRLEEVRRLVEVLLAADLEAQVMRGSAPAPCCSTSE